MIEIVGLFYGDGLATDWSDEVLFGEDTGSVGLCAGKFRKIVRERIEMRLPSHLSAYTWISLVNNRKHEVLTGIVTTLHPEVGRTSGYSDLITIDETIEIDVDDLFAEVILDEIDKNSEAGVGGYVDYIGGAACNLDQLSCVYVCADSHAEEDDAVCSSVVGCLDDRIIGYAVGKDDEDLRNSVRVVCSLDETDRAVDCKSSCRSTTSVSLACDFIEYSCPIVAVSYPRIERTVIEMNGHDAEIIVGLIDICCEEALGEDERPRPDTT